MFGKRKITTLRDNLFPKIGLAYLSYIPAKYVKLDKSPVDSYLKSSPQTIEDFIRIRKSLGKEIKAV